MSGRRAFIWHVQVAIEDGTFLVLGLHGGAATVHVPATYGERAVVKVTAPFEVEGTTAYERGNVSLVHTAGGQVHPTVKLAAGARISGVASGERLTAKLTLGEIGAGPIDLACSAVSLDASQEIPDVYGDVKPSRHAVAKPAGRPFKSDAANDQKLAPTPATGTGFLSWGAPPLIKASIADTEGVRFTSSWSTLGLPAIDVGPLEIVARREGHLQIRVRTTAGSELSGWVDEKSTYFWDGHRGHGEGVSLCGCEGSSPPPRAQARELIAGATIHARPNGPRWASVPAALQVLVDEAEKDGWRRVVHVDNLSEGGGACQTGALQNAWVRASDLQRKKGR